jgi:hypothetical protein
MVIWESVQNRTPISLRFSVGFDTGQLMMGACTPHRGRSTRNARTRAPRRRGASRRQAGSGWGFIPERLRKKMTTSSYETVPVFTPRWTRACG